MTSYVSKSVSDVPGTIISNAKYTPNTPTGKPSTSKTSTAKNGNDKDP
jgi:hypothetical protein